MWANCKIFIDTDKLKASQPDESVYELVNVKNDQFSFKGVNGY